MMVERTPQPKKENDRNYDIGLQYLQELRNTLWSLMNQKKSLTRDQIAHIDHLAIHIRELGNLFKFLKEKDSNKNGKTRKRNA